MRYRIPDNVSTRFLYHTDEVRALDARAIAAGTPGVTLMRRAGRAAFYRLRRLWPQARRVAVLCGGGNNAGDGYVLATLARQQGLAVDVFACRPPAQLTGDALQVAEAYQTAGGQVTILADGELPPPGAAELWVDALCGTGLRTALRTWHQQLIQHLNDSGVPILALDLPSGLDGNHGIPRPVAIRATATVTFVGLKRGLFTAFGPDHAGQLFFDNLGIGPEHYQAMPSTLEPVRPPFALKPRMPSTHKGMTGTCVVLGGAAGMTGAALIAGEAAARCGAGVTRIGLLEPPVLGAVGRPELMVSQVEQPTNLAPLLAAADVLVVGPGLGQSPWAQQVAAAAWHSDKSLVLDADGLNWLAAQGARQRSAPLVLTPHPGEAARLLGVSTAQVQEGRFDAVQALATRYQAMVVLKGCGSLLADTEGRCQVVMVGNPGMASGGMGDLLSGILGALMAQGLSAWEATRLATWLHGTAADRVTAREGEAGLLALDLLPEIRLLMQRLSQGNPP